MEDPWALYLDTYFAMYTARLSSPAYICPCISAEVRWSKHRIQVYGVPKSELDCHLYNPIVAISESI
jgi:hypothetical protein